MSGHHHKSSGQGNQQCSTRASDDRPWAGEPRGGGRFQSTTALTAKGRLLEQSKASVLAVSLYSDVLSET